MLATGMQRDKYLQELVQTDMLLEYAIEHNDTQEIERLQEKLAKLSSLGECKNVWNGRN